MTAITQNRKARFDYETLKTYSAGLELLGSEVKSARAGSASLQGAFIRVAGGEAWLLGADIPAWQPKNAPAEYDALRPRKLLLSQTELEELAEAEGQAGLTIVPLSLYNKGRFLKLDIAIARGKKKFDKRQAIKKRDTEREIRRKL